MPALRRVLTPLSIAIAALLSAAAAFALPALDAWLPGGAIAWQLVAVALALVGAWRVRAARLAALEAMPRRWTRLLAGMAAVAALAWLGGLGLLWLLWPR